jgi:hypothetical protein
LQTGDDLDEGALPCAVWADEADALYVRNGEGQAIKQRSNAESLADRLTGYEESHPKSGGEGIPRLSVSPQRW